MKSERKRACFVNELTYKQNPPCAKVKNNSLTKPAKSYIIFFVVIIDLFFSLYGGIGQCTKN